MDFKPNKPTIYWDGYMKRWYPCWRVGVHLYFIERWGSNKDADACREFAKQISKLNGCRVR